jgi:hypothetical protein
MKRIKTEGVKGSIALTAVVVISAILLAGGINILLGNIDLTRSTINYNSNIVNEIRTGSCLEESIYYLKKDTTFSGMVTLSFTEGQCSAQVDPIGNDLKSVTIVSDYYEYRYEDIYQIDTSMYPFNISQ